MRNQIETTVKMLNNDEMGCVGGGINIERKKENNCPPCKCDCVCPASYGKEIKAAEVERIDIR